MMIRFLILLYLFCSIVMSQDSLGKVKEFELKRIKVIEEISPSVVCIFDNNQQGGGSGVLFHESGYLLTNFHVVDGTGLKGIAGINDGKLYTMDVLGIDPGGDVAIAKLSGKNKYVKCRIGDSDNVKVGEFALVLGNPFLLTEDYTPTVTYGVVSGVKRYQEGQGRILVYGNCIQIDSSINPGNSGGPLFTASGKLIGINGRGSFEERGRVNVGLGYAISLEQVLNFIPDLLATKVCMHGTLDAIFIDRNNGLVCNRINEDSDLAKSGMLPGDVLVSIDGIPMVSANQLASQISIYPAKWPLLVKYKKGNEEKSVYLRLKPLPYSDVVAKEETDDNKKEEKTPDKKEEPKEKPKDPIIQKQPAKESWGLPGEIRDKSINNREAFRLMNEVKNYSNKENKDLKKVTFKCSTYSSTGNILEKFEFVWLGKEKQQIVFQNNENKKVIYNLNCAKLNVSKEESNSEEIEFKTIFEKISFIYAFMNTLVYGEENKSDFILLGGDKVNGRRAYSIKYNEGDKLYWNYFLNLIDDQKQLQTRLLKVVYDYDNKGTNYGEQVVEEQLVNNIIMPKIIDLVYGLEEKKIRRTIIESVVIE